MKTIGGNGEEWEDSAATTKSRSSVLIGFLLILLCFYVILNDWATPVGETQTAIADDFPWWTPNIDLSAPIYGKI
jgi:hypothetical protein